MKLKEKQSLRSASVEELSKKLIETEQNLARFVQERYTKQSKNVREGKTMRNTIARIKTILQEKALSV